MKKAIFLFLIFILISCDNREIKKVGDVVERVHRVSGYKTSEAYFLYREVEYTDGSKDIVKFQVTKEEYYATFVNQNINQNVEKK